MRSETKIVINVSRKLLLETLLTEKQIAKMLYISETTLRQLYIQKFDMPPKRYIRCVKLYKARTLLRTTNKTVSEIAYSIGYINTSKFAEAFRNMYGESPSNYRKICGLGVEKSPGDLI